MSVKLQPGDLVAWNPEQDGEETVHLLVAEDGESLLFQFGTRPWHRMPVVYEDGTQGTGLYAQEVEAAINVGVYPLAFPGYVYKSYDEATGRSFADPRLETE